MPFKFNPLTGNLDLVGSSSSGSGVTRVGSTADKAIARWYGNDADTIDNSKTKIQDGGAIEAQGFITRRSITDTVRIDPGNSWITPSIQLEPTGAIELELDGEVIIV